ncbi:MAG: methyltransferase, partial [Ruminiclostridium sp.]|nr:methyltransferase [Ruminiclostridium sp.]
MNSRERVVSTLKHKEPDMVPLDLGGTDSSGITGIAYNRLRKYLGLHQGETDIVDTYGQIVRLEDDIRDLLKPDTIMLMKECASWKPFKLSDGSQCRIPEKWNPEKTD